MHSANVSKQTYALQQSWARTDAPEPMGKLSASKRFPLMLSLEGESTP